MMSHRLGLGLGSSIRCDLCVFWFGAYCILTKYINYHNDLIVFLINDGNLPLYITLSNQIALMEPVKVFLSSVS